jgi:hypothetical protein
MPEAISLVLCRCRTAIFSAGPKKERKMQQDVGKLRQGQTKTKIIACGETDSVVRQFTGIQIHCVIRILYECWVNVSGLS